MVPGARLLSSSTLVRVLCNRLKCKMFRPRKSLSVTILKKEVIGPNIYSNHDVIRGLGVLDEVTGDRS